jgi:flavin reductase (DIM6/NTAB) family NADH-FMN oxidoreductase RutF
VLLSCTDKTGRRNIITLAWSMPASIDPPMLIVAIAPKRYSHKLIEETEEFVVNVPTREILRETLFCGRRTGREYNKFEETGLTPLPAKAVTPAIIKECVAHLECRLHHQLTTGDHTLFIGTVRAAYADKEAFDERYHLMKMTPVYHMGGDDFTTVSPESITPHLLPKKSESA